MMRDETNRREFLRLSAAAFAGCLFGGRGLFAQTRPDLATIRTRADWQKMRAQVLANLQLAMGDLPKRKGKKVAVVELEKEDLPAFTRTKIKYLAEADDWVMAYLLTPKNLKRPAPAMLCLHQ